MNYEAKLLECGNEDIAAALSRSIAAIFKRDFYLFENDVHERTISATLAFHMRRRFSGFHVDPEYNKLGADPKRIMAEGQNILVVPDVIVHRRGDPYGANLLALEVKSGKRKGKQKDIRNLEGMRRTLQYQYALFIRFGTKEMAGQVTGLQWV